jgi:hypothetical protein
MTIFMPCVRPQKNWWRVLTEDAAKREFVTQRKVRWPFSREWALWPVSGGAELERGQHRKAGGDYETNGHQPGLLPGESPANGEQNKAERYGAVPPREPPAAALSGHRETLLLDGLSIGIDMGNGADI